MHCHGRSSLLRTSRAAERRSGYVASTVTVMTRMSSLRLSLRLQASVPVASGQKSPHKRRQCRFSRFPSQSQWQAAWGPRLSRALAAPLPTARGEKGTCPANAQQRPAPARSLASPGRLAGPPAPAAPRAAGKLRLRPVTTVPRPKATEHKQPADATSHVGGRAR